MSVQLDNLTREVRENKNALLSAQSLLERLAGLIEENKDNPDKLQALADELDSQSKELAAAVLAHTPAEPPAEESLESSGGKGQKS